MTRDLRQLGVAAGQTLLVSASLRSIGWVDGGAASVVAALREALGPDGTLVVPAGTAGNSDSSREHLARIAGMTLDETKEFRARMCPFDRHTTPSTGMGQVAEVVRTHPQAIRSDHPHTSFAALGLRAAELMDAHELTCHLGPASPLGKMYRRAGVSRPHGEASRPQETAAAWVLLLGVSFEACTAFHLAEYLYTQTPPRRNYRYVRASGPSGAEWETYADVVLDDSEFEILGRLVDEAGIPNRGFVGAADCRLMALREIVDFATAWLRNCRSNVK